MNKSKFSQKGLGGIRIPKQYGGAFVSNKTWPMFSYFN
jgi:alkylation response protein AidB-like acyl-CoA dehydrogenase